jgi:hypothetical protein
MESPISSKYKSVKKSDLKSSEKELTENLGLQKYPLYKRVHTSISYLKGQCHEMNIFMKV